MFGSLCPVFLTHLVMVIHVWGKLLPSEGNPPLYQKASCNRATLHQYDLSMTVHLAVQLSDSSGDNCSDCCGCFSTLPPGMGMQLLYCYI